MWFTSICLDVYLIRQMLYFDRYLQANPDYAAGIQPSKDWFAAPQRLKDYVKRRRRQSKSLEPDKGILCTTLTDLLYWHDK